MLHLVNETIDARRAHYRARAGTLTRLVRGVYVESDSDRDTVILGHAVRIARYLYPNAYLSSASSLLLGPTADGRLFISGRRNQRTRLRTLEIVQNTAPENPSTVPAVIGDELGELHVDISSPRQRFLEAFRLRSEHASAVTPEMRDQMAVRLIEECGSPEAAAETVWALARGNGWYREGEHAERFLLQRPTATRVPPNKAALDLLVAWHGELLGNLTHDGFEWRWKPRKRATPALICESAPGKIACAVLDFACGHVGPGKESSINIWWQGAGSGPPLADERSSTMPKELNDVTPSMGEGSTVYVAVEISDKSWVVGIGAPSDPGKVGMHTLAPADTDGLVARIEKARARVGDPSRVLLTYEAGYEGFWLARWLGLQAPQIDVLVCDPASLEVVRKAKRAKTDRIDAKRMVRALRAWDRGEEEALSVVRIPTEAEEDAKRLLRNRERLVKERTRLGNTIKGLLKLQGVRDLEPRRPSFLADFAEVRTAYGAPLPPGLRDEIEATHERLVMVMAQLKEIEEKKAALIAEAAGMSEQASTHDQGTRTGTGDEEHRAVPGPAAVLVQLKGIGANDAVLLQHEVLYRDFRNRREIAAWAGLAPVPWASGGVENDQGISKAGHPVIRRHLVQMAWRWVRYQPASAITVWFHEYCARRRDRLMRKRAIIAVARKLLVALWRYATTGLVPTGAVLGPS